MWNEGPAINAAQWILFGLATFALVVRIGACRRPGYGFWWDDFVMFFSLVIFLATCITATIAISWGCGQISKDVDPSTLSRATLMGIIATDLGMIADSVPKLGIALLIARLFRPRPWLRWSFVVATVFGVLFSILLLIFSFVQCHPVKYQWHRDTMEGWCWSIDVYTDFAFFTGAWGATLDLVFSIYPIFVISQLKMQWRKKVAVMMTMSFGCATFAVTVVKIASKYPELRYAAVDSTRVLADIILWNAFGASFAIIAGSIPTWGWMFHTRRWKSFMYWASRGRLSVVSSRRPSSQTEKWPLNPTLDQLVTNSTEPPPPDESPLTFPQRLHYSGRSYRSSIRSSWSSRRATRSSNRTSGTGGGGGSGRREIRDNHRAHYSADAPRTNRLSNINEGRHRAYSAPSMALPIDSILQLERSTYM